MNSTLIQRTWAVIVVAILCFSGSAHASLAINSVTVNGGITTTVTPGATITVVVNNSGTTNWGSTGWYIGTTAPGTWNCNAGPSPSVSGNNNTYTFTVTAPATPGTYNAYFRTSSNNSTCGSTTSSTYVLNGGVIVVGPPSATTVAASSLSATGATLNGTVTSNGAGTTVTFNYGLTTSYGSSISASQSPLAAGASGAAVSAALTGLTCNTTYHFRVTAVNSSGTTNGGDLTFTTSTCPFSCAPPSNIPPGVSVTCQCDTFGRTNLNPSTIFGGNWLVNSSGTTTVYPYINQTTGLLRLTENSGNNATSATVPGIFPAAGNYISVEFQQYAYNGSGADGMAVTLSDYSVPPVPGAFGGSLGYAQKTGINGFAGGWVGIALDEYGNYENGSEGRYGGISASTLYQQSVGVRGSGSGSSNSTPNYPWLAGATALNPGIDNHTSTAPSYGYYYQVIVDARNAGNTKPQTFVSVNRDTTGSGSSSNYSQVIAPFDIFAANASQVAVPANWQISFTGSTGGSTNIHEIGGLRICAQAVFPSIVGTASGFSAIDEAYSVAPTIPSYPNFATGHIFMKLPGTSFTFKLWVAALAGSAISSAYSNVSAKYVQVKLVDNSNGICGTDTARTCNSACTNSLAVENGGRQIVTFSQGGPGASLSPSFTLNSSWKNLIAVMNECTTSTCTAFTTTAAACSVDSFSVRPTGFASVTSSTATNTGASGSPTFRAGNGQFDLTATTAGVAGFASGYTGTPKINSASVQPASPSATAGMLAGTFSAAISGTPSSTATGTTFSYNEVGGFYLQATPGIPGVYDDSWTATDSDPLKNDCNSGTTAAAYSNTKDASGKFGCNFGISANTAVFGRFIPDHFDTAVLPVTGVPMPCPTNQTCPTLYNGFVYAGQAFTTQVTAMNLGGGPTKNYEGGYAKAVTLSAWGALGSTTPQNQNPSGGTLNNSAITAATFAAGVATTSMPNYVFATASVVPTNIYLRAMDTDNVTSLRSTNPTTTSIEGGVMVVSGRIKVSNAYGSELLPLTLMATAQYYTATGWLNSSTDSVTQLSSINSSYGVGTGTSNVTVSPATKVLSLGSLTINLSAPNAAGTMILAPTIDPASPGNPPFSAGSGTIIPGVATFGVYKNNSGFIYRRESY